MPYTRRQLLSHAAAWGGLGAAPRLLRALARASGAGIEAGAGARVKVLDPSRLTAFVDALPRPPLAQESAPGHYRITMRESDCQLHRDLPPTRCWTYDGRLPGPIIEMRSGKAVTVEWVNALPRRHFLPIDHTLPGAGADLPEVRTVVHLHGARVPTASDGYPEDWFCAGQSSTCHYPNRQDAALLFYHDHAMGISRLNIYAGLFGLCVLRDAVEESLGLPAGAEEIPLVLCDRWLTETGALFYPTSGIPGKPWVPEVFGNAILVNGKLLPELAVEPRAYRLRVLNTANCRFFDLALSNGQALHLIGSDQGLLSAPVAMRSILLAPAERIDLVVDFSQQAGQTLMLTNQEQALMRIRVGSGARKAAWRPPARLREVRRTPAREAVRTRTLTLDEYDNLAGRPMVMLLSGKYWRDPVSERPELGTTEIWSFINTTGDSHPIHLHLVRFQVLDRRPYDTEQYLGDGTLRFTGPVEAPGPDEMGWKDTVRAYASAVTRIIVQFDSYAGRYVWHCHLLEHESNNMMRPYEITIGKNGAGR